MKIKNHLFKTILFTIFTLPLSFAQSVILTPDEGVQAHKLHDSDNDTQITVEDTLNDNRIRFNIQGKEIGVMDTNTFHLEHGHGNLFIGKNAGIKNVNHRTPDFSDGYFYDGGLYNVGIGIDALNNNTLGIKNTALGYAALDSNIIGDSNVAIGYKSLFLNKNGSQNTAVGLRSLYYSTAHGNSAFGMHSLLSNTSGQFNVGFGGGSLQRNSTGNYNAAVGLLSGSSNKSGNYSVFLGAYAGYADTLSNKNVYIGTQAGAGDFIIGVGSDLLKNLTREGNIFIGYKSGSKEIKSNRLYIENSDSETPLIYGNFEDDSLKVNGNLEVTENVNISGFTQLGDDSPAIKLKTILDTSPATENGTKSIAHGLTANQIINVSVYINNSSTNFIPPNYHGGPDYEYDYYYNNTSIVLKTMAANSANVIDKPVKILITYTE